MDAFADDQTFSEVQLRWMLSYIQTWYGDPLRAAPWRAPKWYDADGDPMFNADSIHDYVWEGDE